MSVYLDWAATTPPDPAVIAEYSRIAQTDWYNPSSAHEGGRRVRSVLEDSRRRAADALSSDPESIVFTSGGTESDHIPLLALLQRSSRGSIAISAIEHAAVSEQAKAMEQAGWKTLIIPSNRDGIITPEAVLSTIREDTALVAVMGVNNETGAIQPIREIADALEAGRPAKRMPHFHVDAVQAVGKIPFDFNVPGVHSYALSAHKIGGPRGIGLLKLSKQIEPFVRGGGQEGGLRPGTENVAGAAALAMALEGATRRIAEGTAGEEIANRLFAGIANIPGIRPIPDGRAEADPRFSPFIAQFTNRRFPGEVLVRALSDRNIYISTGSACSSKKKKRPVLEAMRVDPDSQQNAFRISSGPGTTESDIDAVLAALSELMGV